MNTPFLIGAARANARAYAELSGSQHRSNCNCRSLGSITLSVGTRRCNRERRSVNARA